MVQKNCTKCSSSFRTTKTNDETLCAKCEVKFMPLPEDPHTVDSEFSNFAKEIYGDPEIDLNCEDVFNHKARLQVLQEKFINSKSTKEKREIQRLIEETNALQERLVHTKNLMLKAGFLNSTTITTTTTTTTSKNVNSSPQSQQSQSEQCTPTQDYNNKEVPLYRSNSVRDRIIEVTSLISNSITTTPTTSKNFKTPPITPTSPKSFNSTPQSQTEPRSQGNDNEVPLSRSNSVKKRIEALSTPTTPTSSKTFSSSPPRSQKELQSQDSDQEVPLRRSNSVRNRIKAFEELQRSVSTGSWDRRQKATASTPRRKLQFPL